MTDLGYKIQTVGKIDDDIIGDMFALYSRYYDGTSEQLFRHDLADKHYVIILSDNDNQLQGFSTARVDEHQFQGKRLRSFFSGDTIIDQSHWGHQALPTSWFRLTGHIKAIEPEVPLYWFLLVKGHRTYRYLSTFFKVFYPTEEGETPSQTQALMDMLAGDRFGHSYDTNRGIVSFATSHGHLKPAWTDIPEKDQTRPEVNFFLERNPGYVSGDELVCLTELAPTNLRPFAERLFRNGIENGI